MASSQCLCYVFFITVLVYSAHSFSTDDSTLSAALDINPGAPKTRGNKFALAFMNNHNRPNTGPDGVRTANEIGLFITTEQESSTFTIQTRFAGVAGRGFTETSLGSGLYNRTEIATRGSFTFVSLPAGGGTVPDIAVQNNGQNSVPDQRKGVMIEAVDSTHELTIYVLNDEDVSTDAYMAINCVEFPSARDYQYFVFSSDYDEAGGENFQSRFLITPCEDDTEVTVRPSLTLSHPGWVSPAPPNTNPASTTGQDSSTYGRLFDRFDTLMLEANDDLTGSIITSDKPLSVFVGHQCGTPVDVGTCDYLVEQIPPHPSYGDLFFLAPFAVRQSGEMYRIGSVTNGAQVTITCDCTADSGSGNRVALESSTPGVYTATVNRGQYVQCRTPENMQSYCCVQSDQPVTMMSYTVGNLVDDLSNLENLPFDPIADPAMVYIPPAINYLNSYSLSTAKNLTTSFQGYLSYILPERIFSNSVQDQNRLTINGEVYIPEDGYTAINCQVDGSSDVCAYGATRYLGQGNFEIDYTNIGNGAFWGFAYGYAREVSFAYPLAFEMAPVGLAWVVAENHIVTEGDNVIVDLGFRITRGDRSVRTRAFAYTEGGTAAAGEDYVSAGTEPGGGGNSNLRFQRARNTPNNDLTVTILDDDEAEADEIIVIRVECEPLENCYAPIAEYTITIQDDDGGLAATTPTPTTQPAPTCSDLPNLTNGAISYDMTPADARPVGTVATYQCNAGYMLVGETTRTCQGTGMFDGMPPSCQQIINIMFTMDVFSFNENGGSGFVEVSVNQAPDQSFDFTLGSVSTFNGDFVQVSAGSLPATFTFPAGQTSVNVSFSLTDDIIGLEDLETYDVTLGVSSAAMSAGVSLGARSMAIVEVMDDDAVTLSVGELTYSVAENEGPLEVSYILNREAIRDVSFDVVNIDGTATGGGVDYDSTGYSLTIPAGSTDVSRSISITDDGVPGEGNETFTNRINNVATTGVVLGDAESTVTIQDTSVDVTVMFGAATYSFSESGGTGTIEVVTSAPAPFDFDFTVSGGPSTQQFVVNSGGSINVQDSFMMGDTNFTIEFPLTDDSTALEDLESFVASLSLATGTPAGVVLGTPSMATIQISDDDAYTVGFASVTGTVSESAGPATLGIVSTPAARPVTLSVGTTSGGTATPDGDYTATGTVMVTIPAGQTTSSFSVDITDDSIVEGDEDFVGEIFSADAGAGVGPLTISPQQSTITILDNDVATVSFSNAVYSFNEGSGTGSVTIVKNGEVAFPFDIIVSGGPSQQSGITVNADGIDGTVTRTFPPDQQNLTIEFNIGDDEIGLEELERYIATLEVVGSPFGVSAGPITSAEVQVMDDDAVSVGFGSAGITVTETAGQFTMCVRLNRAAAVDVTVTLETQDGTAIDGEDYNASSIPSELVISAGSTEECFTGDIIDDGVPGEPPEDFTITITSVDPDGVTISRDTTVITITDTDPDGTCPALPDLLNGMIEYSEEGSPGFPDGTVATHTCNTGYVLNGASTRTCEVAEMSVTGEFDGVAPVCDPVCDQLPDITNGMISYSPDMVAPYSVATVATYSCNEGYELTGPGNEMRTCRDNGDGSGGDFDGTAPTCEPVCDQLPDIANGVISYASDMVAPYSVSTVATYSCNEGYELTGPGDEMRTCRDNGDGSGGDFDGTAPTCEPVCDQLPDIANGVISYASDMVAPYSVSTVATYSCNEGYELTGPGNEMRTCRDNGDGSGGDFDGTAPTCEPVCDQLPDIANGVISYASDMVAPYSVSTVATYSCNEGYELTGPGNEMRTCRDNGDGSGGDFDGTAPTCEPVCDQLPDIANGVISYASDMVAPYSVSTVATYSCNEGYELTGPGNEMRTCRDNGDGSGGDFDGTAPTCEPVCDQLPDIANGVISYASDMVAPYSVSTVATYSCDEGYELTGPGNEMRTCRDNGDGSGGDFDGTAPTCEPVCDQLPDIANGMISYSPDTEAPYSVATVATYSCNEGYILRMGDEMRTCSDNGDGSGGDFDGTAPTCEPQCLPLPTITNGMISYGPDSTPDYDVGTVATYVCDDGFFLIGSPTRECQSDRNFSGTPPVCSMIPAVCPELPAIENGMITYSVDETPRPIGTVATYTCNDGFFLNGVMTRTCVEVGNTGMFDQEAPTCDPIECDPLDPLVNGVITYSPDTEPDYELGTVADHMCNRGFTLVGPQTRVCEDVGGPDGEFNQQPPVCEQIFCSDLPTLANAVISYSGGVIDARPVDTEAMYQCEDGFNLVGDSTRTCQEDGMFDGTEPFCTPLCSDLPELVNGMIDYSTDNPAPYPIGTVATYSCNDGYAINGPENRTCEGMGSGGSSSAAFNLRAPVCDPVCDEIPEPPLITITYPTDPNPQFPNGTVAVATCREGFSPGTTGRLPTTIIELVCIEVLPGGGGVFVIPGTATNALNCEPTCNELPVISNGAISYSPDMEAPYNLGTVATYVCIDGYELVGDMTRNCVNSSSGGMFDGSEPFCRPGCDELPPITNGMISYATDMTPLFEVGTVATYTCNDGFSFVEGEGNQMRTCAESDMEGAGQPTFDGSAPRCETGNMTTCTVEEPMMVSPFTRSTSYTFMGSCERVLLQSCNSSVSFMVRTDFITDSAENGAVGVFLGDDFMWISREDGNVIQSGASITVSTEGVPGRNEITVGGGIGVTVIHTYGGTNPSIQVIVNSGSSLGETCGLCGTQTGQLRRSDGSIADITDMEEVEAFTLDYLTPADQQALRPIRRECSMLRNDTIIGDPLYTVALTNTGSGPTEMCYEVRGSANQHYNLISDSCVSVNALYAPMNEPEFGNIMQEVGVRVANQDGFNCSNIRVTREGCRAFVSSSPDGSPVEIDSTYSRNGIMVRRYSNRVRISTPNCDQVTLVLWVQCVTVADQDMLHFVVSRGINLRPTSHGLLGQFWNIPVTASFHISAINGRRRDFYQVTVQPTPDTSTHRSFLAESYPRTWDKRRLECLYVGNSQGGSYNELQDDSLRSDSIIQGNYRDYRVSDLYDSIWTYGQFMEDLCDAE